MKSVNYRLMYQDKERAARKGGSFPLFLQEQMATLAVSLLVGSLSVYRKRPVQGRAMIAPLSRLVRFFSSEQPPASEASVSGRSLRAAGAGAERAPAARRRRNTPGGHPAQGANAPERASRPGGARGAPGRASARAARRHTAGPGAPRAAARAASHTKRGFCRTYLPYKIPAAFCMTVHFSRRGRRTGAGRRGRAPRAPGQGRQNEAASTRPAA